MKTTRTTKASETKATIRLPYAMTFAAAPGDLPGQPTRKPGRGDAGWTVGEFASVEERDAFMNAHQDAAMPCWKRVVVGHV